MSKNILVGLSLALLSTSAGLAAHRHHHHRILNPRGMSAAAPMVPAGPMAANGDYDKFVKNLHDSGYDKKKDYNPDGTMRIHY